MTSLCFYFPYKEDSGVPVLFYRMANAIASAYSNVNVSVIDYENGVMARNILSLDNLKLIPFVKNIEISPPVGSILVMQSFVPYYWPVELKLEADQRLFFWNLHPQNLVPSLLPIPFLRDIPFNNFQIYRFLSFIYKGLLSRLREYVQLLVSNKALYFMDKSNVDYTSRYLFLDIAIGEYLPVPATYDPKVKLIPSPKSLGQTINFGWIGRLCDFKSYILVYTINKISKIATRFSGRKFVYHIMGEGQYMDYVKHKVKAASNISVIFHGAIPHNQLDDFINQNIDIVTAMGTSALEGAKLSKPTILLDAIFRPVKEDYVFRLLSDTKEYDLAHFITKEDYLKDNDSLFEIVSKICSEYSVLAEKSREYFLSNHDISHVANVFVEKVEKSALRFSMINPQIFHKGKLLTIYNKFRGLKD